MSVLSREEVEKLLASMETSRVERTISTTDTDKFCEAICTSMGSGTPIELRRSLYALVIGLFCGRWTLMALGEVDYGLMGVVCRLTAFIGFLFVIVSGLSDATHALFRSPKLPILRFSDPTCGLVSWCAIIYPKFSSLNEPWCESPRRYGVEESLAHIFCIEEAA